MSGIYGYPTDPAQSTGTVGTSAGEGGTVITEDAVAVKALNNAMRGIAGDLGNFRNDIAAAATSTGSSNAYVLATGSEIGALADGLRLTWLPNHSNTGAATLNVDTLGAKKLLHDSATLAANEIKVGHPVDVVYDASADSAAGAWLVLNPVAAAGTYTSDDIGNDSDVTGATVTEALDQLDTDKAAASHTHDASAIDAGTLDVARIPDLAATKITSGTLASARLDTGTTANKIVQLDGSARLPAVDASQLTNLPGGDFTPGYTSSEQTLTASAQLTLAHGLGSRPHLINGVLRCKISEDNWSVGDELELGLGFAYGAPLIMGGYADTSNVYVRYGNLVNASYFDKTTGSLSYITPANWRLIVKAWA